MRLFISAIAEILKIRRSSRGRAPNLAPRQRTGRAIFRDLLPCGPVFPVHESHIRTLHCYMRLRGVDALCSELAIEFFEDRGAVAVAG